MYEVRRETRKMLVIAVVRRCSSVLAYVPSLTTKVVRISTAALVRRARLRDSISRLFLWERLYSLVSLLDCYGNDRFQPFTDGRIAAIAAVPRTPPFG